MRRRLAILVCGLSLGASTRGEQARTLTGQVVCSECWAEADRSTTPYGTPADLKCALDCAEEGKPRALAVQEGGRSTLYLLYPGGFNPGKNAFLELVPQRVRVTGRVQEQGAKHLLFVDSIERISAPVSGPRAPGMAPELELQNLVGALQRLSALKGQVLVVNFWATFCPPCLREMPMLAQVQRDYAARKVQVLGVAVEPFERRRFVQQLAQQKQANYPIWIGASTQHMEAFGLGAGLPGTAVVGHDGTILARLVGELSDPQLRSILDDALARQR